MARKKATKKAEGRAKYVDPGDEYIYSQEYITIEQLSKKWKGTPGCSLSTLARRSKDEGWPAKREEFWKGVRAKMHEQATVDLAERLKDSVVEANERHMKHGQLAQGVGVKILQEFKDSIKDMKAGEAYRAAVQYLKNGVDIERKALGLADQVVKVQFAREVTKEVVDIVTKYVHDPDVLENIQRDREAIIERERQAFEHAIDEVELLPSGTVH